MSENIRRRKLLATAAVLGVALAAGMADSSHAQSGEKFTLKIANSQWLDALRGKNLWVAVQKYQEVAPNVTLEQEAIPSAEFADKLTTEMGAGQGPDIAIMQEGLFYALADAGFLVDIAKAADGVALNKTNDNGMIDGVHYGIAWQRAAYALIYNRPVIESAGAKVPATVEELIASSKAASAKTPGVIGFTARHQINDFSGWFMDFQNWAYGYGVNWVDKDGKLTIDTPEAVAAVTAFKETYASGIIPIGDSMPTQRTRFKEKHVAFSIDNSGGTLNIASGGALASADMGAAPMPFKHPGAHQQIFLGVSSHSKHPEEAIKFLSWLVSKPGQQALREASGPDALATDVPVTDAFAAANPWAPTFAKLAQNSRSTLIPGHEMETAQIMRFVMQAVEKAILSNMDPKIALAEAQSAVGKQF
ncbi:ABC transporter substrate-binding protein [Neorhizobium alkalisoli]|uniref:ABC transporter substrate-binding protein n=1 Tax=Neorhizobium alkalisoli TaxID=528178 RepID=UPI000CF90499|nr:extracellular solute-binding protein [Neorhizobium alkalisoli]